MVDLGVHPHYRSSCENRQVKRTRRARARSPGRRGQTEKGVGRLPGYFHIGGWGVEQIANVYDIPVCIAVNFYGIADDLRLNNRD